MKRTVSEALKESALLKKITIFAASSWALIEVIDFFAGRYGWPQHLEDIAVVVFVSAIPFLAIWIFFKSLGQYKWLQVSLLFVNVVIAALFIRHFITRPATVRETASLTKNSSLLVLPFKALGDSVRDSYFSEGVTSSLIDELTKLGSLAVLSESVSAGYRNKTVDLADLADKGVTHLLQGKVQREGKLLRVAAQLVDTKTGLQIWAEKYERELVDIFKLHDDIAGNIARALSIQLSGKEAEKMHSQATGNLLAYDEFLKGKYFFNSLKEKDLDSAIYHLEKAVSLDPSFAKAYAELANAYARHNMFITDLTMDYSGKAYVASEKALQLDSSLSESYYARAYANWTPKNKFQHSKAISDLRKALKIDPKNTDALNLMAKIYMHIGLLDESLIILKEARQYNPLNGFVLANVSSVYFFMADFPKMMEAVRTIPPGYADDPYYHTEYALGLLKTGHEQEAEKILLDGRKSKPEDMEYKATYAVYLALKGKKADAMKLLNELENVEDKEGQALTYHHVTYFIGVTYALLNDQPKAIEWLTWTADNGFPSYTYMNNDPFLKNLKTNKEFQALLKRLHTEFNQYKKLANE